MRTILTSAALTSCLLVVSSTLADEMDFPGGNWTEVTPESAGLDSKRLAEAVESLKDNSGRDGVNELVIVRRGRIIWKGDNIDKVHGIWSCTKSFTSTVLGLLIDDGKCSLDTQAKDAVPELANIYPDLRLRHFSLDDLGLSRRRRRAARLLQARSEQYAISTCRPTVPSAGVEIRLLGFGDERVWSCADEDRRRTVGGTLQAPHRRSDRNGCRSNGTGAITPRSITSSSTAARETETSTSRSPRASWPVLATCFSTKEIGMGSS